MSPDKAVYLNIGRAQNILKYTALLLINYSLMTLNSTYPQRSYNARFAQVSKPTNQVDNARAQSMVVQKTPIVNWGRDAVHKRSSVAISVGKQSHRVSKFHCEFHVS